MMTAFEFLQTMYSGAPDGFLSVWTLPDKKTAFFPVSDLGKAVRYAEQRFDTHDVYFGVGLRGKALAENQRGGNADVSVIPAFWSDIDIKGAAHKETALPESAGDALGFLNALPLKPSIVVNSGNGLHAYWLYALPLAVMTEAHRKNIGDALRGWQTHINAAAKERGWKLDNTSDLARVLRLPGGVNHKLDTGQRAEVISVIDARYAPYDFTPFVKREDMAAQATAPKTQIDGSKFNAAVATAQKVIDGCAFIRHCRDNAANLPEPHWYAMVGNLSLCPDGAERVHEFSKPYPKYDAAETGRKIIHAKSEAKPHTCEYIRNSLGFDCGECAAKCKSPVSLAIVTKADTVRELLEAEIADWTVVFDEEHISAFAYAKAQMPADYAKFKMRLKGKANITDVEKCIKDYDNRRKKQSAADGAALSFDDIDLGGAVIPKKWQVSERGVRRFTETKNGTEEVIVCPDPAVITRRLVNIDDGKERLEISFRKDGCWKQVIGGRTQVYNKASIISFGDEGLHVTSGTAAELVSYLSDYETVNKAVIPRVSSIGRLGWVGDAQFFPYALDGEVLFEEDKGTAALYHNLAEHGDYGVWKSMMAELRKNPIARFITAAAFASPLLCKVGVRTFVIHLWHMSASGKSAALKAAVSVWGNPLRIMGNGFTTIVGTEQLAGTLRNLPFGIDEKQSADERRLSLEQLVYVLGQGSGKIRGARGGGNADVALWHNIVMLTGEEPITRNSSLDGIQTRTFEIYGKPIDDVEFAKQVHIISESNYGFAGAAFMRAVCANLKNSPDYLKNLYTQVFSVELKSRGMKNIHADYVAAVALGDYLAETLIFGTDGKTAMKQAIECGEAVYGLNEAQLSTDAVERAWDFVTGWLVSNEGRFSNDATPYYGKTQLSPAGKFVEFYVIPQYLDGALDEAGFNVKKTLQGFKERGLIETQVDSAGSTRTKYVFWLGDKAVRGYVFRLKNEGIVPLTGKKE